MDISPDDEEELERIFGKVPKAQAERLLDGIVFQRPELEWSIDLVKLRLMQAAKGIERCVTRPGPSTKLGFWPAATVEWADQMAMIETRELDRLQRQQNRAVIGLSSRQVSEIEQALRWPGQYLGAEAVKDERRALQIWLWCEATNSPWERFCAACGCSKATANRRRKRAFDIILFGLLKEKVLP